MVWFHFSHVIDVFFFFFFLRKSLGFDIAICVFICVWHWGCEWAMIGTRPWFWGLSCFKVPWCCLWVWRWLVSFLMLLVLNLYMCTCVVFNCIVHMHGLYTSDLKLNETKQQTEKSYKIFNVIWSKIEVETKNFSISTQWCAYFNHIIH